MVSPKSANTVTFITSSKGASEYRRLKANLCEELKEIDGKDWTMEDYAYPNGKATRKGALYTHGETNLVCSTLRETEEGRYKCKKEHLNAILERKKNYEKKLLNTEEEEESEFIPFVCWAEMALITFVVNIDVPGTNEKIKRVCSIGHRKRAGLSHENHTETQLFSAINDIRSEEFDKPEIKEGSELGKEVIKMMKAAYQSVGILDDVTSKECSTLIRKYIDDVESRKLEIDFDNPEAEDSSIVSPFRKIKKILESIALMQKHENKYKEIQKLLSEKYTSKQLFTVSISAIAALGFNLITYFSYGIYLVHPTLTVPGLICAALVGYLAHVRSKSA